ncbi:MAG TPA: low molecular weight protein arginine phosphatase [Clostridiaceae bacterium]|nr:low molecular weight protein arginine phosphatase [Clostridiaceae bacterium]
MKVLFVCTGNTCRSPMAEVIFNEVYRNRHTSESRGLHARAGDIISPEALIILNREYGYSEHRESQKLGQNDIVEADVIITMTEGQKLEIAHQYGNDKLYTLKELAHETGDVMDPYGQDELEYVRTFSEIRELITKIELFKEDDN